MELPKGKAPGDDRLPSEFYHALAEDIIIPLQRLAKEIKDRGMMNTTMSRGKIILISKPGDRRQIKNYRPITLLNAVYKLQAKTIATKMKPMLLL